MRVFGRTGEPRDLFRCVGQRARSTWASWYAVEGKEPKSTTPSFFSFLKEKKKYKEIRLSDETKLLPALPTRTIPILLDVYRKPI